MPIPGLVASMDRLIELYGQLLTLAKQKTGILVHNEVEQLNQIVHKETQLMKQVTESDRQRVEAIGEVMRQKGYTPNSAITITELMKLIFNAEDKQAIAERQKHLLAVIDELRQVNALNQQMIEQSLAFIEHSMDVVLGPPDNDAVYQNPMQQAQGLKRKGYFDTRA